MGNIAAQLDYAWDLKSAHGLQALKTAPIADRRKTPRRKATMGGGIENDSASNTCSPSKSPFGISYLLEPVSLILRVRRQMYGLVVICSFELKKAQKEAREALSHIFLLFWRQLIEIGCND